MSLLWYKHAETEKERERKNKREQNKAISGPPREPLLYTSQPPRRWKRNMIRQYLPPKPRSSRSILGYRKMKRRNTEGWNIEKKEPDGWEMERRDLSRLGTALALAYQTPPHTPEQPSSQRQNSREMAAGSSCAHRHTCTHAHWCKDAWILHKFHSQDKWDRFWELLCKW